MLFTATDIPPRPNSKSLSQTDARDIWIARWLNIRRVDIVRRYGCDPRRIYEIWNGNKFPDSRERARDVFLERYPSLKDRVDFGHHQTIPRHHQSPDQLGMFEETNSENKNRTDTRLT